MPTFEAMEVRLFGAIAEKAGSDRVQVQAHSTAGLLRSLLDMIPDLRHMRYALAVDRRIVKEDTALTGTEEIALLPPFAGG
jgi:molybdopterin converting factor small subunit